MNKIALVTYSGLPQLTDDDRLLIPSLRRHDLEAEPAVWDATVDWALFDQVILRSCWDYHLRVTEFLEWIGELERLSVPVLNSPRLVRWNADKKYLRQLQDKGSRIPETVWIGEGEEANVQTILESQCWSNAVAKPTVSASAHCLKRVFIGEPAVRMRGPAMVQQFIPEILVDGEWSLVFIQGQFSHAALKRPTAGEFRVQAQYGGTAKAAEPSARMISVAKKIIDDLPETPLYARVDGTEDELGFLLMEVELIEPVLFLGLGGGSDMLAQSIANLRGPRNACMHV
jgi:glutathione synthase/RimK-type ligase-like ATP-grasp enzyme